MKDSREHDRWPGEDAAERLLNGEDVEDADAATADLARLLAAAGEPLKGRPEDEQAALMAFRAFRQAEQRARSDREGRLAGAARRRRVRGPRSVKALVGGIAAVLVLSGVAIAAKTGALPPPFHSAPAPPSSSSPSAGSRSPGAAGRTPGTSESDGTVSAPVGAPAGAAPGSVSPSANSSSPFPAATVSGKPADPEMKGQCKAYVKAGHKGRTVDAATLARLSQAAGGTDKVDAYCAALLGTNAPADTPTVSAGVPTVGPSGGTDQPGKPVPAATTPSADAATPSVEATTPSTESSATTGGPDTPTVAPTDPGTGLPNVIPTVKRRRR
jgi:hypothetical protein